MPPRAICATWGPSPRVRGAAMSCSTSSTPSRDHPRGCGEQNVTTLPAERTAGPSPRVRGAGDLGEWVRAWLGTIPAGAGSSLDMNEELYDAGDHPRGCGEQPSPRAFRPRASGPSPRVRGADDRGDRRKRRHGTIPAGAGSSPARGPSRPGQRDHPRGCGEQSEAPGFSIRGRGPSPRVRGAVRPLRAGLPDLRTIPAGAGSSESPALRSPASWDHPRGCGEQLFTYDTRDGVEGPSPRVRGADSATCGFPRLEHRNLALSRKATNWIDGT